MSELQNKVKELFEKNEIDLFIGYEKGTRKPRPVFVSKAEDTDNLIFDEHCSGNLAVYLTRKDLVSGKKVGISASYYALKSIAQLFDENQLKEENLRVLGISKEGKVKLFDSIEEIKQYLTETPPPAKHEDNELVRKMDAMTSSERLAFWTDELSKCFKCYACRSACPMCYCTKCIVEVNRPQWIQPWAGTISNMEWQINRVMHLAGRCSDCGSCGAACPLGIPIHILTHKMAESVKRHFGDEDDKGNVLSTFKPDDKENFIH
jgi:ferredoxin